MNNNWCTFQTEN